ncbi:MAG: hypothetical protein ACP5UD_04680 [Conexivisphaera sp.]
MIDGTELKMNGRTKIMYVWAANTGKLLALEVTWFRSAMQPFSSSEGYWRGTPISNCSSSIVVHDTGVHSDRLGSATTKRRSR